MGLKDKLLQQGSTLTQWDGSSPFQYSSANGTGPGYSKLHDTYSINDNPHIPNKPTPSSLDLNGATPPKYVDNLPG